MKLTKYLSKRINRAITRLMDSSNDIIIRNTAEMVIGLRGETVGPLTPARAEEMDFLSINEWMKTRDDHQPTGRDY